jgi:hypothetical protein
MTDSQRQNGAGHSLPPIPTRAQLEQAGIRIAVGIPMERNVQDAAFLGFWQIARRGWPLVDHLYGRTDANRNKIASALVRSDFTHVFMLDLDHIHAPDIVEHHARWVLDDPDKLVVGGLHFRRGEPFEPCAFVYGPDGDLHAPADWEPGLYKVGAIGHGSILISRKVFEQLPKPWWAYTYQFASDDSYPSEDMFFCSRCRQAGIDLWCDTTITSPHLITNTVDESTFRTWLAEHPANVVTIEDLPEKEVEELRQENARRSKNVTMPDMVTRVEA